MAKKYLEKNVLEATLKRLEIIFSEFENIYFSVSGGKDSSVMVQLANKVAPPEMELLKHLIEDPIVTIDKD